MNIVMLADDLTGAADAGAGFAVHGFPTRVILRRGSLTSAGKLTGATALDTHSRSLSEKSASKVVVECWQMLAQAGDCLLYKKIDSTLRGHWVAEVSALRRGGAGMAILAPAFPQTGRTTKDGYQYVHGETLKASRAEREGDAWDGDIGARLAAQCLQTTHLPLSAIRDESDKIAARLSAAAHTGVDVVICDAEATHDLSTIAEASLECGEPVFLVGSAGLACELARLLAGSRHSDHVTTMGEACARVLILVGTPAVSSQQQADRLTVVPSVGELVVPASLLAAGTAHNQWTAWQARIGAYLANSDLLMRIDDDTHDSKRVPKPILSRTLVKLINPHVNAVDGFILTGGDSARAMLDAMGVSGLDLHDEIAPGVVLSTVSGLRGQSVVTKAGTFGGEEALLGAYRRLKGISITEYE